MCVRFGTCMSFGISSHTGQQTVYQFGKYESYSCVIVVVTPTASVSVAHWHKADHCPVSLLYCIQEIKLYMINGQKDTPSSGQHRFCQCPLGHRTCCGRSYCVFSDDDGNMNEANRNMCLCVLYSVCLGFCCV